MPVAAADLATTVQVAFVHVTRTRDPNVISYVNKVQSQSMNRGSNSLC